MSKTYTKLWAHFLWSTKNRERMMSRDVKIKICKHIHANARAKDIHLDTINGHMDRLHALVSLKADQSASEAANLLKGESTHWINEQRLVHGHFAWEVGFTAFSVSASQLETVRQYIRNQEEHHRTKTFQDELDFFFEKCGIAREPPPAGGRP